MKRKLLNLLKKITKNNFRIQQLFFNQEFSTFFKKSKSTGTPIIIYTDGKVGSTTFQKSLENANRTVFHIHRLNATYLQGFQKSVLLHYFNKKNVSPHTYRTLLWKPLWVKKNIISKQKVKYFTAWRDPISKNISSYFQWLRMAETEDEYHFTSFNFTPFLDMKVKKNNLQPLMDYFLEKFDHFHHEKWIKEEWIDNLGFNYLQEPFPLEQGYQVVKLPNQNAEIFITNLENYKNENVMTAMQNYFEIDQFEILHANSAEDKNIGIVYKKFMQEIIFDEEFLNNIYNSPFMKNFYTKEQIQQFKSKWKHQ